MFNFKNGISPVIAVILLLAITVVISMSMYSFLQDYTENITSPLSSTSFNQIKVIGVYGDNLYLNSKKSELFSLFQIKDLNGNVQCEIRDSKQTTFQGDTRLLLTFDNETFNGTHVKDLSGYNNHGVINNSTYTENNCVSKGCFEFNGESSFISIPEKQSITNFSEFSISLWFKTYSFTDNQFLIRNNQIVGEPDEPGYWLVINPNSTNLYLGIENESNDNHNLYSYNTSININQFYNLIVSFDEKNKISKFYLDGSEIFSQNLNFTIGDYSHKLMIGSRETNTGLDRFFNGTIDELALYSKFITKEEAKLIYENKNLKFYEQLLTTKTKEINISNCNLNKGNKYEFIGILESGNKVSKEFIIK